MQDIQMDRAKRKRASKHKHYLKYKEYYKAYRKKHRAENKQKYIDWVKNWVTDNPVKRKAICQRYLRNNPIRRKLTLLLAAAKQRCNNPKNIAYKYYGGRGVRCYLELADVEFLWVRDKGYELKKATLDRVNPDSHYRLMNCRIIEASENSKRNRAHQFVKYGTPQVN